MRRFLMVMAALAVPAASMAAPYPVADTDGYDPYAAEAIERSDYAAAEDRLQRRLDEDSADVPALLNLAAVMTHTDRVARASSLLEQVLDADNELLADVSGEAIWSHDAADAALRGRVTIGLRD